jgi:hypothetical protein
VFKFQPQNPSLLLVQVLHKAEKINNVAALSGRGVGSGDYNLEGKGTIAFRKNDQVAELAGKQRSATDRAGSRISEAPG